MILCTIILFKVRNLILGASMGLKRLSSKDQKDLHENQPKEGRKNNLFFQLC